MTGDEKLAAQIKRDYRQAALDPKARVLLDYAVELTRDPHSGSQEAVNRLREHGWRDEEILTATHIIGFFNYYVRLAEGLGVEPEDFMQKSAS